MLSFLIPQNQQQNRGTSENFDEENGGSSISFERNIRSYENNNRDYNDYNHQFSNGGNRICEYGAHNNGWGDVDDDRSSFVGRNSSRNCGENNCINNAIVSNKENDTFNDYGSNNYDANTYHNSSSTHNDISRSKYANNSGVSSDIIYIGTNNNVNHGENHSDNYTSNNVNNNKNTINNNNSSSSSSSNNNPHYSNNNNYNNIQNTYNSSSHSSNTNYNVPRSNEIDDDVVVLPRNDEEIPQNSETGEKGWLL
jgi:hypothetical protein